MSVSMGRQAGDSSISNLGIDIAMMVHGVEIIRLLGLRIADLEVETTIDSDADTCTFTVHNIWDANASEINMYDSVLSPGNDIQVLLGLQGSQPNTVFAGVITHITVEAEDKEGPLLRVRCTDSSMVLMSGRITLDSWQTMSYSDVVQQLAATYGLNTDVDTILAPMDVVVREDPQDNDFQFLQKLAERVGYQFYVTGKTICFKDSAQSLTGPVLTFGYGKEILSFSITADLLSQVPAVQVLGWDHTQGQVVTGNSGSLPGTGIGAFSWTGPNQLAVAGSTGVQFVAEDVSSSVEATNRAQLIFNNHGKRFIQGWAKVTGDPTITTGCLVHLAGIGARFATSYFESYRVRHSVNATEGYTTTVIVRGNNL